MQLISATSEAQAQMITCRVPVPLHVNNLGTPRDQEGKQVVQAAPAVLQGTSTHRQLQPSSDSNGLVHKLLSLPSFGKVVYRSTSMSSLHSIVSKQHASGSAFPKALGVSSSQQMLMQGHASLGTSPPSLDFDSQFESGNLQKAVQASSLVSQSLLVYVNKGINWNSVGSTVLPVCLHMGMCMLFWCPPNSKNVIDNAALRCLRMRMLV